jgi:hypothetical protein
VAISGPTRSSAAGLDSAFRLGFTDGHEHLAPPYEMDRGF